MYKSGLFAVLISLGCSRGIRVESPQVLHHSKHNKRPVVRVGWL